MRQDLWICHLTGIPARKLSIYYNQLEFSNQIGKDFDEAIIPFLKEPITDILVDNFTVLELSLIFHLAAGHDIISIARYKGISEVRVRQAIKSIKDSEVWNEEWLSNAILQMTKSE